MNIYCVYLKQFFKATLLLHLVYFPHSFDVGPQVCTLQSGVPTQQQLPHCSVHKLVLVLHTRVQTDSRPSAGNERQLVLLSIWLQLELNTVGKHCIHCRRWPYSCRNVWTFLKPSSSAYNNYINCQDSHNVLCGKSIINACSLIGKVCWESCMQLNVFRHEQPMQHPVAVNKEPRLKTSCTHLDKKLQYCSSGSCCINKRSYEPLRNQPMGVHIKCMRELYIMWRRSSFARHKCLWVVPRYWYIGQWGQRIAAGIGDKGMRPG